MKLINTKASLCLALFGIALALVASGARADKPSWAGDGQHKEGNERHEEREHGERERDRDSNRHEGALVFSFGNDDRRIINEYYGDKVRKGKCPPGLAKKHNGCQPPGHAKKWQRGQPLAKDIEYHELPRELRLRLPVPPPNHRYVQVAGDILVIAVGSSMVIDAIEDILR